MYRGVNGFESRHPEYMGFVKPEFENVFLRLRKGKNDLNLAVSDSQISDGDSLLDSLDSRLNIPHDSSLDRSSEFVSFPLYLRGAYPLP